MDQLLEALRPRYPELRFAAGPEYRWAARQRIVHYVAGDASPEAIWGLLHETGHGILGHNGYQHDFELLQMEMDAWAEARRLALSFEMTIDEDHVQDCLDTYRSWLYRRSICPTCEAVGLQRDDSCTYGCFNCGRSWRVSTSQFCRPYRSRSVAA